jgi:hypothetical protein
LVASTAAPVAYRAFLSYSHVDERQAARLHQRLEGWRIPPKLVSSRDGLDPAPHPLSPIFRDREELSAGDDLSAQVQVALQASDMLIVLCSPAAKASRWVNREIEMFRALHPGRPVLAAIISGEPADSFPEALTARGNEPIAADLRKDKDGARLGLLKLVAGLTGLPLAALVQRDAQRQMRRVMAITGMAVAGMLIMALLTILAARARNEAQVQRQQAEGLVEYMLTDLRDRLKGVGRLDVMTAVNERAMDYYTKQGALDALPPDSLERRARILHAMGEDDEKRGDLGLALRKFTEAHRTTAAALAQRPESADAIFAHAQSEYWVGYVAYVKRDFSSARHNWQNYRHLASALEQQFPGDSRSLEEVGYATTNLCVLAVDDKGDPSEAVKSCGEALSVKRRIAKISSRPAKALADLSNSLAWLADAREAANDWAGAAPLRQEQAALLGQLLTDDPRNNELKDSWVNAQLSLANASRHAGDDRRARTQLAEARTLTEDLIKADPDNQVWRKKLIRIDHIEHQIKRR